MKNYFALTKTQSHCGSNFTRVADRKLKLIPEHVFLQSYDTSHLLMLQFSEFQTHLRILLIEALANLDGSMGIPKYFQNKKLWCAISMLLCWV